MIESRLKRFLRKAKNFLFYLILGDFDKIVAAFKRRQVIYYNYIFKIKEQDILLNNPINPIFLLGTQGGGLTFISRVLKRHELIYYATGNKKYWTGFDEISNVYPEVLPDLMTGYFPSYKSIKNKIDIDNENYVKLKRKFGYNTVWAYASDYLLKIFEKDEDSVPDYVLMQYIRVLYSIYKNFALQENSFLLDKSQINSIRIPLLWRIFKDKSPKFIVITRNPYVMIWRAIYKLNLPYNKNFSLDERFDIACSHYKNTFEKAINDLNNLNIDYLIIKYEDIMETPIEIIKNIHDFIGIDFKIDQLPSAKDKLPIGSLDKDKWWEFKKDINNKYFKLITKEDIIKINKRISNTIKMLDYELIK